MTTATAVDHRFSAMGTQVHVQVIGGCPGIADQARHRIDALEARWSRFRSGSDISELNRSAGRWVPVAWETIVLLQRALAAASATDGRFDPTVGAALIAHGYDRTFAEVSAHARTVVPVPLVDASWPAIEIDVEQSTACLAPGTVFDPGGIGKGVAADLLAEELAERCDGILVNVGGDLRVSGTSADPSGWVISVDNPFDDAHELTRLAIATGAVATSSTRARRWRTATGDAHHIIDPSTGRPAVTDVAAVTVVASHAWWAEAQATSLLLQGPAGLTAVGPTAEALMVMNDGSRSATAGLAAVMP
jgi:thiamine biosynthesis lipoprotein